MDTATKDRLGNRNLWLRLLHMVLFAIAYTIAEAIIVCIAIFQFLSALFTGSVNAMLLRFGTNLSHYMYEILQFVTFNDEQLPFPFSEWPDREPGSTPYSSVEQ